jgi:hypothetical protein
MQVSPSLGILALFSCIKSYLAKVALVPPSFTPGEVEVRVSEGLPLRCTRATCSRGRALYSEVVDL